MSESTSTLSNQCPICHGYKSITELECAGCRASHTPKYEIRWNVERNYSEGFQDGFANGYSRAWQECWEYLRGLSQEKVDESEPAE